MNVFLFCLSTFCSINICIDPSFVLLYLLFVYSLFSLFLRPLLIISSLMYETSASFPLLFLYLCAPFFPFVCVGRLKGKVKVGGGRIDDETRRLVHQNKLNSLEHDDYQRLHDGEEDAEEDNERRGKRSKKNADEEYVEEDEEEVVSSSSSSSKKRKRPSKSEKLEKSQQQKAKSSFLPIRKWEDIQLELQDEADEDERNLIRLKRAGKVPQDTKPINYFSIAA